MPEYVSVIGFDDMVLSQYFTPKLSTYKNPIGLQGITAAKTLIHIIENGKTAKSKNPGQLYHL